jgi:DNA-binding GntR family transcriptional regulator
MLKEIHYADDLATKSYKTLRTMILRGELAPGQKLIQEDMAQTLGISRIPLIHAISHLANENLINIIPRKGAYVRAYSAEDHLSFFDINSLLAPLGAFGAAALITAEGLDELSSCNEKIKDTISGAGSRGIFENNYHFHLCIYKWSGNTFLPSIMEKHCGILTYSEQKLKDPEESYSEHQRIIQALRERDKEASRELMFFHVNGGMRVKFAKLLENQHTSP